MKCKICGKTWRHDARCPNYIPHKAVHYCSTCGQGIYSGEEYIENDNGEYRHYDCVYGLQDLLEWLGYEIKTLEDFYEEDY